VGAAAGGRGRTPGSGPLAGTEARGGEAAQASGSAKGKLRGAWPAGHLSRMVRSGFRYEGGKNWEAGVCW